MFIKRERVRALAVGVIGLAVYRATYGDQLGRHLQGMAWLYLAALALVVLATVSYVVPRGIAAWIVCSLFAPFIASALQLLQGLRSGCGDQESVVRDELERKLMTMCGLSHSKRALATAVAWRDLAVLLTR